MVADLTLRDALRILYLVGVATVYTLAGAEIVGLFVVCLLLALLGAVLVREIRNRRWDARVARWDRPEVWLILDAVRDRETRRLQSEAAWRRLSSTLAELAASFTPAVTAIEDEAQRVVSAFDNSFRGFGDRLLAAELARPQREVRYL